MTKTENITLSKEEINKFRSIGALDEIGLRDEAIRREFFRRLIETSPSGSKKKIKTEIKTQLADEYNLSYKKIDEIVYRKERRKKVPTNPIKELK
jgi:hypothetical protein